MHNPSSERREWQRNQQRHPEDSQNHNLRQRSFPQDPENIGHVQQPHPYQGLPFQQRRREASRKHGCRESELTRFLRHFIVDKQCETRFDEISHTFMNARVLGFGKVDIPDAYLGDFYTLYARALQNDEKLFIVELTRRLTPHPLFLELDIVFSEQDLKIDTCLFLPLLVKIHTLTLSCFPCVQPGSFFPFCRMFSISFSLTSRRACYHLHTTLQFRLSFQDWIPPLLAGSPRDHRHCT